MRLARQAKSIGVVDAAAVLLSLFAIVVLVQGILHRSFDYDEWEHAHVIWLIKSGLRPFLDFFECHPPFLWYPLGIFFRLFGDTYQVLFAFRFLTALGHVLVLVGIAKNVALSFRGLRQPLSLPASSFLLGVVVIAGQPLIVDYLLEFRLDAWPNALLLLSIHRYRSRPQPVFRSSAQFAFLAALAILCSPKLLLLLVLFFAASVALDTDRILRASAMAVGGFGGLLLGAGLLVVMGLNPISVYRLFFSYHHLLNKHGGFGYGLATAVWAQPIPLGILIASVCSAGLVLKRRVLSSPFEVAAAGFLALQIVLVAFRYKQYYGPWFVLGIAFIPYLEVLLKKLRPLHSAAIAAAIVYASANVLDGFRSFDKMNDAATEIRLRHWEQNLVPPNGTIAASLEVMPIFRRGVFYHSVNSFAPSGYDTATVMTALAMRPFSKMFTEEAYARELESKRPDLVVVEGWFPPLQRKALDTYLQKFRSEYLQMDTAGGPILVRQRGN